MADGAITRSGSFTAKVAIVALAAVLVALVFALRHVLLLAFGAILIAVGLRGLASAIETHTPLGRKASLAIATLTVLGVVGAAIWLLGAQISEQIKQASADLPSAWESLRARLSESEYGRALVQEIEQAASGGGNLGSFASRVGTFTMSAAGASLEFLVLVIAAAFLTIDAASYRNGVMSLAPKSQRERLGEAMDASATALRKWLLATLISVVFLSVVLTTGLWLLGVPAPLALGLLAGLAQFVPMIGPILAAVPAVLLALTVGPQTALWVALLYFVASQIESNLLYPVIQKKAVSLPPVLTLFSVIAAGLVLGPLGALFATPLVVVISVFVTIFYVRGALGDRGAKIPGE